MRHLFLAAALVAGLSACSHYGSGNTGTTAAATQPAATQPATQTSDAIALGTVVTITPSGFSPKVLVAPTGQTVTWRNESGSTQSVHFDNAGERIDSGPIPPGGTWAFDPPGALSLLYHSTYTPKFRAQLQVQLLD